MKKPYRFGVIMKFLGNQYWQLLANGMHKRARDLGIPLDVQAAATESDPEGQLERMMHMLGKGYDAILISPQTDKNLMPAVTLARRKGILLVNVDDAVLEDAEHFVGPKQYENGERAAAHLMKRFPAGGKVALVRGIEGVYAVNQRSAGLIDALKDSRFQVVVQVNGDWDLQKAMNAAQAVLKEHPDLVAFYCNNDIMALGVVMAVKRAGLQGKVEVIGTDGIEPAYASIERGELTATVDSYPFETGIVAVEVALRLLEGQTLPRVIFSPQKLVTLGDKGQRPDMRGLLGR